MSNDTLIIIIGIILGASIAIPFRLLTNKKVKLANQIATLVAEKRYKEAISLGESQSNLDGLALMNLGGAYYSAGNKVKAKESINKVKLPFYYSSSIKKSLADWKQKVNS